MKVTLVGAGPYDFDLLTLRGMKALCEADVVVYDRLANIEFLRLCKEDCETIDVGKKSNQHRLSQDKINELLLKKACEGKQVVRLKGGDPFLFGRGSEELRLLQENNVPFEVIPGISSAIAVPSYAGIPVTDRAYASSLHIFTGHAQENAPLNIDFEVVAKLKGTLVFLMSVSNLSEITHQLIGSGMNPKMPVALIENGTSSKQRKWISDLEQINEVAVENNVVSPALFVVGEVCTLSESYDWFSKKPLFCTTVVVAGHKGTSNRLEEKLRHEGADVKMYPCIETSPIHMQSDDFEAYEWLVFSSKQGVNYFFKSIKESKIDIRKLAQIKIATVGIQTAEELKQYSLYPDYIPMEYNATSLAKGLLGKIDGKVLIIGASAGTDSLKEIFQREKIAYSEKEVYRTSFVEHEEIDTDVDYVMLTSASAVHGWVSNIGKEKAKTIIGICIGEKTANVAISYGIKVFISKEATTDSMVALVKDVKKLDSIL